jgi:hypothetical protein
VRTHRTYSISAIRFDDDETLIELARVHREPGHVLVGEMLREWVLEELLGGNGFLTVLRDGETWRVEEDVKPVEVAGRIFLRVGGRREDDDLGELPEF